MKRWREGGNREEDEKRSYKARKNKEIVNAWN